MEHIKHTRIVRWGTPVRFDIALPHLKNHLYYIIVSGSKDKQLRTVQFLHRIAA